MMTRGSLVGYGVGDFGINLYFMSVMTWLLIFYTDVMGISAFTAAGIFAVARFVDALSDPLMGMIAERTKSRWGRMRPYLLFGAMPLGVISVLTFTVPDLDLEGRIIWAYTTYILFGLVYTLVTIPYSTLTASLTSDYSERTRLSTYRIGFAFAGGWIASVITEPFVASALFVDKAEGFLFLMILFSIVSTVLLWITYRSTEEVVATNRTQKLKLVDSLRSVFLNPPLFVVIGIFSFTNSWSIK